MTASEPKTSFIPKKTLVQAPIVRRTGTNLFLGLAFIVFFLAVAAAGGVYAWKTLLLKQNEASILQLNKSKSSFEPQTIGELKVLDDRMKAAEELLKQHRAFSNFFERLEEITLRTVRFSDFSYQIGQDGILTVNMAGRARNYSSVALQSDVFGKEESFTNPIFSNLGLDDRGNVTFDFQTEINPELITYRDPTQ